MSTSATVMLVLEARRGRRVPARKRGSARTAARLSGCRSPPASALIQFTAGDRGRGPRSWTRITRPFYLIDICRECRGRALFEATTRTADEERGDAFAGGQCVSGLVAEHHEP